MIIDTISFTRCRFSCESGKEKKVADKNVATFFLFVNGLLIATLFLI